MNINQKKESQSNNFIVYELETNNTNKARPHSVSIYSVSKLASKYNLDLAPEDYQKFKKFIIVFDEENCNTKSLDYVLKLKAEPLKVKENKLLGYELQLQGHNGFGFDNWNILKNLICERRIV